MVPRIERQAPENIYDLKDTEEWKSLNSDQMRYLSFYIIYRDSHQAAILANLNHDWVTKQERQNPRFAEIVRMIISHPKQVAEAMREDTLPLAAQKLVNLIAQDENKLAQLGAIKELHSVTGVSQGEITDNRQQINVNVQMFRTRPDSRTSKPRKKAKIVDAEPSDA